MRKRVFGSIFLTAIVTLLLTAGLFLLVVHAGLTRDLRGIPTALIVNKDNKVEQRELVANRTAGAYWLVEKGLNAGDRVITEGLQYVKPGAEVKVTEASNAKPAGTAAAPAAAAGQGE